MYMYIKVQYHYGSCEALVYPKAMHVQLHVHVHVECMYMYI